MLDKGLLKGVETAVRRPKALDGGHASPFSFHYGEEARVDGLPIYHDGAGPALALTAAIFRSLQLEHLPQEVEQGPSRFDVHRHGFAVQHK
jgi:hypothetical protein